MLIKAIALVLLLEAIAGMIHPSISRTSHSFIHDFFSFCLVNGVPLRVVGPQDGSPEEIARVKTATSDGTHVFTYSNPRNH